MVKEKKEHEQAGCSADSTEKMEDKGVRFVPKEGGTHDGRLSSTAENLSSNWIGK